MTASSWFFESHVPFSFLVVSYFLILISVCSPLVLGILFLEIQHLFLASFHGSTLATHIVYDVYLLLLHCWLQTAFWVQSSNSHLSLSTSKTIVNILLSWLIYLSGGLQFTMFQRKTNMRWKHPTTFIPYSKSDQMPKESLSGIALRHTLW